MNMPGFAAEFSLERGSNKSHAAAPGDWPVAAGNIVTPQYMYCHLGRDGWRFCCETDSEFCWSQPPPGKGPIHM